MKVNFNLKNPTRIPKTKSKLGFGILNQSHKQMRIITDSNQSTQDIPYKILVSTPEFADS